jgi:hypothetical protein
MPHPGSHWPTAVFTPTDPTNFQSLTSNTVTFTFRTLTMCRVGTKCTGSLLIAVLALAR